MLRRDAFARRFKRSLAALLLLLLLLASSWYNSKPSTVTDHALQALPVFTSQSSKQRQTESELLEQLTRTLPEKPWLAMHDVTAILLHHRRPKALALHLKALSRHAFVREIIVWNNNDKVHLIKAVRVLAVL